MSTRLLLILLCCTFFVSAHLQSDQEQSITLMPANQDIQERVSSLLPSPVYLSSITYTSDVALQKAEFFYLTDLKEGMLASASQVAKAITYLFKKRKFSSITVSAQTAPYGTALHMQCEGVWTFRALKLHGFVLGKDKYRQYYLLESGDPFDEQKHQRSLEQLREAFTSEGYFNCVIDSWLDKDTVTKSITAHCTLNPHKRFRIGTIDATITEHEHTGGGAHELHQEIYHRFLAQLSGAKYSKTAINDATRAIKRSLARKGFLYVEVTLNETVQHDSATVDLVFSLELHPLRQYLFRGNLFFSDDQLLDTILLFGQSACIVPPSFVQQEFEQLYRKYGFWQVAISMTQQEGAHLCSIVEGPRACIKQVTILGDSQERQLVLKKKFFAPLIDNKQFDDSSVLAAIDNAVDWYVAQGYLDARVIKQAFVPLSLEQGQYNLVLTLDVGQLYLLKAIEIDEYPELLEKGPLHACVVAAQTTPTPCTLSLIQQQQQWIISALASSHGMHIKLYPTFKKEGNQVTVVWQCSKPSHEAVFGKTILLGSTTFPFEYILRELQYRQGQAWNAGAVQRSMDRLRRLNIFETIYLYPDSVPVHEEQPLILKLQQDDRYEFRMRAGFAVQQVNKQLISAGLTYRIGGAFFVKNPLNVGDQFWVEADVDRSQRTCVIQYKKPWLGMIPVDSLIQGYNNKFQYPGLVGCEKNLYEVIQQGLLVGLMHTYKATDQSLNIGVELMETTIGSGNSPASDMFSIRLARALNFAPELLNVKVPYIVIEPTFFVDTVDNKLYPTRGICTLLTLKGMIPFGPQGARSLFVRLFLDQSAYISYAPFVLAARLRAGHIFYRALNNIMPPERFYLGGANSIRSYETDRCPPLGCFDDNGCVQLVPQGGKSMLNVNVELRFPLFKKIGGVIFQDLGLLSGNNIFTCAAADVLAGTGFGLRYITPIGPLRFDIAFKWRKSNPTEAWYAWFFSVGNAF